MAFSNNAGGQHKTKHILKVWSYTVDNTYKKTVHHKFLIPGHSFMECDQNFGVTENTKNSSKHVFVPDDWLQMRKKSKHFTIVKMTNEEFISLKSMNAVMKDNVKGIRSTYVVSF
jgi:hypothetical protein